VSEAVPELKAMYLLVVVVECLKLAVASLPAVWAGVELTEPKVVHVEPDFAPGSKNLSGSDHALKDAEPTRVWTEPGQSLVPMGLD